MKVFVVWRDYNGVKCEHFPERNDEARTRVAGIMSAQNAGVNGTFLMAVIEGNRLIPEVVQRVSDVRFKEVVNEGEVRGGDS